MKRPPFKLDGRGGMLRWTPVDPRLRNWVGDRSMRLVTRAAEQAVAGTGIDFEISKSTNRGQSQWQPLRMTYDEAVEYLRDGLMTKGAAHRAEAVRERREEAGKPTFAREEYDR